MGKTLVQSRDPSKLSVRVYGLFTRGFEIKATGKDNNGYYVELQRSTWHRTASTAAADGGGTTIVVRSIEPDEFWSQVKVLQEQGYEVKDYFAGPHKGVLFCRAKLVRSAWNAFVLAVKALGKPRRGAVIAVAPYAGKEAA